MAQPAKTYRRGREAFTAKEVQEITGARHIHAIRQRLVRWERGEIDTETLLKPTRLQESGSKAGETERLLSRIPGPTEYERQHQELLA